MDRVDIHFEAPNDFERIKIDMQDVQIPLLNIESDVFPIVDIKKFLANDTVKDRFKFNEEGDFWEIKSDNIHTNWSINLPPNSNIKIPNHRIYRILLKYPICSVEKLDTIRSKSSNEYGGQIISFKIGYDEVQTISEPVHNFIEETRYIEDIDCWKISYFEGQYDEKDKIIFASVNLVPNCSMVFAV
ncbi:hypothetical protein [Haladaptatus cibarius]|uniref:hypothetical protein n=1 Tax=Haladaptatus cibarius TaxID=453847 RepID=UPI000679985A|nr:hypothetical protein [Haladaptatus cibarius]